MNVPPFSFVGRQRPAGHSVRSSHEPAARLRRLMHMTGGKGPTAMRILGLLATVALIWFGQLAFAHAAAI